MAFKIPNQTNGLESISAFKTESLLVFGSLVSVSGITSSTQIPIGFFLEIIPLQSYDPNTNYKNILNPK